MFRIPFLLQYLLSLYGLHGVTLLSSCLWLSVNRAGALFGQIPIHIEENNIESVANESYATTIKK